MFHNNNNTKVTRSGVNEHAVVVVVPASQSQHSHYLAVTGLGWMCGDRLLQRAIVLNRVCYSRLFVTTKTTLKKRVEHLELDTSAYAYPY